MDIDNNVYRRAATRVVVFNVHCYRFYSRDSPSVTKTRKKEREIEKELENFQLPTNSLLLREYNKLVVLAGEGNAKIFWIKVEKECEHLDKEDVQGRLVHIYTKYPALYRRW